MSTIYAQDSAALSKSDEKQLFRDIVAQCPDGYVRDILESIAIEVHRAIDSDFGCISKQFETEISDLHSERDTLADSVRSLREQSEKLQSEYRKALATIRESEQLKKQLRETVSAIRNL